jgi:uroporphyrinogen-III synthase
MLEEKPHIISLRTLSPEWIHYAAQAGITIQDFDFLQITIKETSIFEQKVVTNTHPLIFTSQHAIQAVAPLLNRLENKQVFVIKGKTYESSFKAGFQILASAKDSVDLANAIVAHHPKAVLHCTTSYRRPALDKILSSYSIDYQCIEVYDKQLTPRKIDTYDGLIFFSPSQVDAFIIENELLPNKPAFCIGKTTADHLRRMKHYPILVAQQSSISNLITLILDFYKKTT